jgi:cobalt/nickel transport system permease protein
MITEPFAEGSSPIHAIDPRLKILAATLFSLIVALCQEFTPLVSSLVVAILLIILARLEPRGVAKRLLVVCGFILLIWIALPLTFDEGTHFSIGPLRLSHQGLLLAGRITLKSSAILLAFMALVATMPVATLGQALWRLRVPVKLVHLFLMTYRYIFVIEAEYLRLHRAAKVRGFSPGSNLHTYRTYAYLIGMLFIRASIRADRVFKAMLCRGFQGRFYSLYQWDPSPNNWIFAVAMASIGALLITLEIMI